MISKDIHYCWVGGKPKPKSVLKCIESWKKYCPDYTIHEWNESNLDLENAPAYIQEAYKAQKWGFVSDYFRLWIIYTYGGIYFDTDVQVIKSLDPILENTAFVGLEGANSHVALGVGFGAEPGNQLLYEHMHMYDDLHFVNDDGTLNLIAIPVFTTELFQKHGFCSGLDDIQIVGNITVYPREFFSPKSFDTGEVKITKQTLSIHQYDASWFDDDQMKALKKSRRKYKMDKIKHLPNRILLRLLGEERYGRFKSKLKRGK